MCLDEMVADCFTEHDLAQASGVTEPLVIVGIDAAAQPRDVALARGVLGPEPDGPLVVTDVAPSCRRLRPAEQVAAWVRDAPRALLGTHRSGGRAARRGAPRA